MTEEVRGDEPEEWADVPGHEGRYVVSNHGRVRGPRKTLSPYTDRDGYPRVGIGMSSVGVHVLVAAAFLGPRPDGYEVAHKDHNRANARLDNLEYLTHADNVKATASAGRSMRGETHNRAVIDEATARAILAEYRPLTQRTGRSQATHGMAALARQHNTTLRVVRGLIHGETWRHLPRSSQKDSTGAQQ